jgi:hypothetical protein
MKNPPIGMTYNECYDAKTGKPREDYLRLYFRIRKELEDLGLEFKY